MNWGNRVNDYRRQLTALKNQGWLTQADINKYWNARSDAGFQNGINLGKGRKEAAAAAAKHKAGLARTGGLERPGRLIDDRYYQQFLGISKQDLLNIPNFEAEIRETRGGYEGTGGETGGWVQKLDRYKTAKPSISDVEYVIRQKYSSAYDPSYARNQLRGNRRWELQSQYVGQYVDYAKSVKNAAQKKQQQTAAQKQAVIQKGIRRNTIMQSWSTKGKFPTELRGKPSAAKSAKYPGRNALSNMGISSEKVVARSRPKGTFGSTQARSLSANRSGTGTKATSLSGFRTGSRVGTAAKSLTRKKSTGKGTRAKKVS